MAIVGRRCSRCYRSWPDRRRGPNVHSADTNNTQHVALAGPPPAKVADTVGLVDVAQGRWHLRNSAGEVTSFSYGNPGDLPIAGDWDGDATDSPAAFRGSAATFFFKHTLATGPADRQFGFGEDGWLPVAGPAGLRPGQGE